jgi:hypothetical protein
MGRGANQEAISRHEIQPLVDTTLVDVAHFLHRSIGRQRASSAELPVQENARSIERRLRWLLIENPVGRESSEHGLWIRDASGGVQGLLLAFPGSFLAGDRRVLGLGSGGFFVEREARTLGFYLFKRYLNSLGYDFFFATTCNANSSVLWKAVGAHALPDSDTEYILPLKIDVLLPAFLSGRTSSVAAKEVARAIGWCANPVLERFQRRASELVVEPCRDWDKLSELFLRHRSTDRITTERSVTFLQWRYGPNAANEPFDIFVFRDASGNEGWFALGTIIRGRHGEIRGRILLDVVWPREKMGFRDIWSAIVSVGAAGAHAIYLKPRRDLDYGECGRWLIPWRRAIPTGFALARRGSASVMVSSLDLVAADGEGVF